MIFHLRGGSGPGDVTAPAINNLVMYAIVCALGTPPKPVNLLFDTGSGILWVKPDKYKTADSSMHKVLAPGIFTITNGCGKKKGTFVSDKLMYGNVSVDQDFGVVDPFSGRKRSNDGLVALEVPSRPSGRAASSSCPCLWRTSLSPKSTTSMSFASV